MAEEIINKVAQSALTTIDLEAYYPEDKIVPFDLKPFLFMELILKEKEFRAALQGTDWSVYRDQVVAVFCSNDAIIPLWAYMLVASYLAPLAKKVIQGDEQTAVRELLLNRIREINPEEFRDKRVVIKGCGEKNIGAFAYLEITSLLRPVVKSIMYGEPCSTVPIYKSKPV
ncbi:MAG TPA: DUF2480 family protein [Puia sp.]|nr:DUF2480 family protein [Puia sp.]